MIVLPPATFLPYESLHKNYRLLWHQGLGTLLRYAKLPRKTINFDLYPINKLRHSSKITLGGAVTTIHLKTITDAVVSEVWLADGIAMDSGFFYELLRFYNAALDTGEHLIWYPKDRSPKAFSIQPIGLTAGSADEMDINPINLVSYWDYRFITTEIRFSFRIRRVVDIPEAVALLEGT